MPSPRRILLLLASMVGAALVGWVAAASMAPETRARSTRQAEDLQVELLMQQLQNQEELSEAERGLLLERLVTLERLQEAEVVLQPWLSGRSTPRELSLFKADLQRRNGQPEAARRSLQHLLRLHPNDLQVLQLLVLLDQEQGRQRQVTAELTARFKGLDTANWPRRTRQMQGPCWPWPYCGKSKAIQRRFKPCSSRPENGGMPMGGSIP